MDIEVESKTPVRRVRRHRRRAPYSRRRTRIPTLNAPTLKSWNTLGANYPQASLVRSDNEPYWVVLSGAIDTVLTTGSGVTTYQKNFTTSDFPSFSSGLSAAFDQYWIKAIEFWLVPYQSQTSKSDTYCVIDYDDSNSLSIAQVQQYQNCCQADSASGFHGIFHPHVAVAAYGGSFTTYKNEPSSWIDSASTGTQHYGVKMVANINSSGIIYNIRFRALVGFRGPI